MQIIKSFLQLTLFVFPALSFAQSTYLMQGSKEYQFLDRLEIKQGVNTDLNFSTLKPYSRKAIVREAEYLDSARMNGRDSLTGKPINLNLTAVDEYNLHSLLMNNSEWVTGSKEDFQSTKPILKSFYKTKANMIEVDNKDFFLAVNPVFQFTVSKESNNDETLFLNNRGVMARGMIGNKVGFSSFLTDNQERGPLFFQGQVNKFGAVPGVGFYKRFKSTGVDYFDARGYVTFSAAKYIDFQFGYDKNFIGNGYRSMFLSDWGNSYLFFKINTRVWKFNYQNLFMELMPQFAKNRSDTLLDRKYAAMHHLSMNVTKWLNIGLFEGIIFGRVNHFDFQYLNPVIFLRHIEGTVGSPDNAVAGIDFKANAFHRAQFYGQLMLDEFILRQITKNTGYWANKYGIQLGAKYVDAFNINNLDLQFETNHARPYTYSHSDNVANYTHYNQPLAHPLGANFSEYIGIMKYQPLKKWNIYGRLIYFRQGLDSGGINYGSNPFENYNTRPADYGFFIGTGKEAKCLNGLAQLSYEWKENLFLEGSLLYRTYRVANVPDNNSTMVTLGVRWNMFKRDYDY